MTELIIQVPDEAYQQLENGKDITCTLSGRKKIKESLTEGIVIPKGLYPDVLRFMADQIEAERGKA